MVKEVFEPVDASRRALLKGLTAGLFATGGASAAFADDGPEATAEQKLLNRITYFPQDEDVARLNQLGYNAYLEEQLNPHSIDDSAMDARLAGFTYLPAPIDEIVRNSSTTGRDQLTRAVIMRATYSKRQLFERMVEFWTDHLNIDANDVGIYKLPDDRNVIRQHALGTFPNLIRASSKSVAMLRYLDNDTNRRTAPNQNYARELMELHTLGVDGGYTQTDVEQVAKAFTGWTYFVPSNNREMPTDGHFRFIASNHDTTAKTVLGVSMPAGRGIEDGEQVVEILVNHPSTARFIAQKMTSWLLQADPNPALVDQVAHTYSKTGGDIKAMIRTILARPNVEAAAQKYKRPFHHHVAILRSLRAEIQTNTSIANTWLPRAGHQPFRWSPPNGYPDSFGYWGPAMLPRWNFAAAIMTNGVSNTTFDLTRLGGSLTSAAEILNRINQIVFLGQMSSATSAAISTFLSAAPITQTRVRDAYSLAYSAPEFQWMN